MPARVVTVRRYCPPTHPGIGCPDTARKNVPPKGRRRLTFGHPAPHTVGTGQVPVTTDVLPRGCPSYARTASVAASVELPLPSSLRVPKDTLTKSPAWPLSIQ